MAPGRGSSGRRGRLTSLASRAIWSTSRRKTTKPRQAMMRAMKEANWASVLVMRSETDRKATKSMRGRTATRTKMTAAASRMLIALDTKPGSLMGDWTTVKSRAFILQAKLPNPREESHGQSAEPQAGPEVWRIYDGGWCPEPGCLAGPGHRHRHQGPPGPRTFNCSWAARPYRPTTRGPRRP